MEIKDITEVRLSRVSRVQVTGTIIPGAMLLLEFGMLASPHPLSWTVVAGSSTLNDWALFTIVVVAALASYVVGVAARSVAWSVWRQWRLHGFPRQRRVTDHGNTRAALKALEDCFGEERVADVLSLHPSLWHALDKAGTVGDATSIDTVHDRPPVGEGLVDPLGDARSIDALDYMKYWLREHHPAFGIDQHEVEISLWVSLSLPLALLPLVAARFWLGHLGWWTMVALAGPLLSGLAYQRARTRAAEEFREGLRAFLFAHWYDAEQLPRIREG